MLLDAFGCLGGMLVLFRALEDKQIMGLELLSISLGMCTFEHVLRGRRVVVH